MNKKIIEKMPLKEKKYFVVESCLMYKKLKSMNLNAHLFVPKKKKTPFVKRIHNRSKKSISIFETILNLLHPDEKLVIDKEYLEKTYEHNWYQQKWSKTTYYKIKHQAINNFLFLLYA